MSLYVEIKINYEPIDYVTITRTEAFKGADKIHHYTVESTSLGRAEVHHHRYSDGAHALVRRALQALEEEGP